MLNSLSPTHSRDTTNHTKVSKPQTIKSQSPTTPPHATNSLEIPDNLTKNQKVNLSSLEIRMARSENLPVLPQAVSHIMKLADDINASQRDLEKAFERDPAIAAKILKVANSPYYGHGNVPNIGRAISLLGMCAIRSLVVSVAFQQALGGRAEARSFDKYAYWRHSLAVAIAARILGKLKMPSRSEELYCAGMLHEIGFLVLDRFLPAELDIAIKESQRTGKRVSRALHEILGYDEAVVGGLLAEAWGLTDLLKNSIRYQNKPEAAGNYHDAASIVATADLIAHLSGFPTAGAPIQLSLEQIAEASGLPAEQITIVREVVDTEVAKVQETFQIAA